MEGVKNYQFKKFDKIQKNDVSVSEVLLRNNKSNLKENKNVTKNKEKNITLNRSNE